MMIKAVRCDYGYDIIDVYKYGNDYNFGNDYENGIVCDYNYDYVYFY